MVRCTVELPPECSTPRNSEPESCRRSWPICSLPFMNSWMLLVVVASLVVAICVVLTYNKHGMPEWHVPMLAHFAGVCALYTCLYTCLIKLSQNIDSYDMVSWFYCAVQYCTMYIVHTSTIVHCTVVHLLCISRDLHWLACVGPSTKKIKDTCVWNENYGTRGRLLPIVMWDKTPVDNLA